MLKSKGPENRHGVEGFAVSLSSSSSWKYFCAFCSVSASFSSFSKSVFCVDVFFGWVYWCAFYRWCPSRLTPLYDSRLERPRVSSQGHSRCRRPWCGAMKSPSTKRSRASSSGARFSKAPDKFTYFLRRQSQTAFFVILLFGDLVLARWQDGKPFERLRSSRAPELGDSHVGTSQLLRRTR